MSNLIPVKRPDRNGKIVTRHVRDNTVASGRLSLPSPSMNYYDATTAVEEFMDVVHARGASVEQASVISQNLYGLKEESRIMVMDALESNPDVIDTSVLCHALHVGDELYIRTTSLNLGFCSDLAAAFMKQDQRQDKTSARILKNAANRVYAKYQRAFIPPQRPSGEPIEVSEYDSERDDLVSRSFKAETIASIVQMESKSVTKLDYYSQYAMVANNSDLVDPAVFAIVEAHYGLSQHNRENGKKWETASLTGHEVLAISQIVYDLPEASKRIYDIMLDRGEFNDEVVRRMLSEGATSLSRGVL